MNAPPSAMPASQTICLADKTTMSIGGTTRHFYQVTSADQIPKILKHLVQSDQKIFLLGGGSNIVVAENLGKLAVVQLTMNEISVDEADDGSFLVTAAAGKEWDELVSFTCDKGLSGIECLSGIPGHVGAAPVQNIGAYGQELSDHFIGLEAFDRKTSTFITLNHDDCRFGYRESIFKSIHKERYIITKITLKLTKSAPKKPSYQDLANALQISTVPPLSVPEQLHQIRKAVLNTRATKGMLTSVPPPVSRSCGSFFTNPVLSSAELDLFKKRLDTSNSDLQKTCPIFPTSEKRFKLSAGWLIEQAGFKKGYRVGPIGISPMHTLAIINYDHGSAKEVFELAQKIKQTVLDKFGIELTTEPTFIPEDSF